MSRNWFGSSAPDLSGRSRRRSKASSVTCSSGSLILRVSTVKCSFLEHDAEILGVGVHEDDDGDRFINALAIRADRQGEGSGRLVLRTLLDDLSERFPGRIATWLVAPANFASHAISDAAGAEATYPPETKPYALYAVAL